MNDEPDIHQIIRRIEHDYYQGNFRFFLHEKSRKFLKQHGLSMKFIVKLAIENLKTNHFYRGPSGHHWLSGITVYEFIEVIDHKSMYVKFDIGPDFTQLESYHPQEKPLNITWFYHP